MSGLTETVPIQAIVDSAVDFDTLVTCYTDPDDPFCGSYPGLRPAT